MINFFCFITPSLRTMLDFNMSKMAYSVGQGNFTFVR